MDAANLRDPATAQNRVYIGHINENVSQELLQIKFSPYGNIVGILRTAAGFCFIQYDNPNSALNAIKCENGSNMGNLKITVKNAEMKSQKRNITQTDGFDDIADQQPMNKKYFSEANEYYGNNSIMADNSESDVNHCEIIVVSKHLVQYAEEIEKKLKMLGIRVDLLFPNDQFPMNKVLGNIQSRGCLYAILLLNDNYEHNSLTLTILYGDPSEHRNMPTDDAIKFLYKDFCNKTKKITPNANQHPDAIQTLLKSLVDGRSLTVLQYDHTIQYLTKKKEVQRKAELGEDAEEVEYNHETVPTTTFAQVKTAPITASQQPLSSDTQGDLHRKIMDILNKKSLVTARKQSETTKPLSEAEKEGLKKKLLHDDKIKQAMLTLRFKMKK